MMRMTVLASGSKGNSIVVSSSKTRILVDAGLSCRELFKRMRAVEEDPETLDAILITHEHQDHVQGLAVTARKLGIPVYFTEATHRAWMRWMMPEKRMTYADWLERRKAAATSETATELDADDAEEDGVAKARRRIPSSPRHRWISPMPGRQRRAPILVGCPGWSISRLGADSRWATSP